VTAIIGLAGMPVDRFLAIEDSFERILWLRIAERVLELRQKIEYKGLSIAIANAVGKMLGGK
jgi:hypothetical protein